MANDFDSPWKDAIQQYLRAFLEWCFPHVEAGVDWSHQPEFLEQELRALVPDSELREQRVDQLIRVWELDGTENWLLLHVEVQSQRDSDLAKRLYQYHGRLTDRYNAHVVTLCVLPRAYEWEFWGCSVTFRFPTCKLLDYNDTELEASMNPIAVVIRAHLAAKDGSLGTGGRYSTKKVLVIGLYERGLSEGDIRKLFNLIDWLIKLPRELDLEFRKEIFDYERRKHMPYISSIERIGIEKGLEQGREQALRRVILQNVERRYGSLPVALPERISLVHSEESLQKIFDLTWDASALADFEARLDALGV